jgi:hypothetical protein
VGFPVEPYFGDDFKDGTIDEDIYEFTVHVDGVEIDELSVQRVTGTFFAGPGPRECIWFGWMNEFKPGTTQISVGYEILTTPDRTFDCSAVHYSLFTGSLWKGPIGTAVIRMHFPVDIDNELITAVHPLDPVISGRTASWEFKDYEPGLRDNLFLQFMSFECRERIRGCRQRLEADPHDAGAKIELAKAYLATMRNRGAGSRKLRIGAMVDKDFGILLAKIENEADKRLLWTNFERESRGPENRGVYMRSPQSELDDVEIDRILFEVRYKPYLRSRTDYYREAEELLLQVLEEDPENAYAWNLYLSHMFKMIYGAWGPVRWSEMYDLLPYQRRMIEKAYSYCPGDDGIRLWHDILHIDNYELPEYLGRLDEFGDRIMMWIAESADGSSAIGCNLTPDEFALYLAAYERRNTFERTRRIDGIDVKGTVSELWRRDEGPGKDEMRELIRCLDEHYDIRRHRGQKIAEYNRAAGIY